MDKVRLLLIVCPIGVFTIPVSLVSQPVTMEKMFKMMQGPGQDSGKENYSTPLS